MLLGTFEHNLDDKLRLTIPSKLRNKLGELLIVSKSIEHCLEIRTLDSFEKWRNEIAQNSSLIDATRQLERLIFSNSEEISVDNAGRIKISTTLLEKVSITKQVYILGLGNRLEIWDKATYETKVLNVEKNTEMNKVANQLGLGGVK